MAFARHYITHKVLRPGKAAKKKIRKYERQQHHINNYEIKNDNFQSKYNRIVDILGMLFLTIGLLAAILLYILYNDYITNWANVWTRNVV
jgi:hypothetical protein